MGIGAQPLFLCEPEDRGAHQPLVQPEWFEQLDQATQPDPAAAGQDGIAEDRHDQRARANPLLLAKSVKTLLNGWNQGADPPQGGEQKSSGRGAALRTNILHGKEAFLVDEFITGPQGFDGCDTGIDEFRTAGDENTMRGQIGI